MGKGTPSLYDGVKPDPKKVINKKKPLNEKSDRMAEDNIDDSYGSKRLEDFFNSEVKINPA